MKLTILGNNGPYPRVNGATSGYLLQTEKGKYVLDFGSGVLANLQKYASVQDIDAIILSHLHFDHISDLGVLAYFMQVNKMQKIKLYVPEINDYISMLLKTGFFTCVVYGEGDLQINNEKVTTKKVKHPVLTYSVTFTEGEKVFSYTGDTTMCDNLELLFKESNVVLCDTAFLKDNWNEKLPHLNIYDACKLAKDNNCKVILSHFTPKLTKEGILEEAFGDYIISGIGDEIII